MPGVTGTLGKANSHFDPTQTGPGTTPPRLRRLLIGAENLKLCCRSGRNCLPSPSVLLDYNGSLDTRFFWATTQPMSWPDGERYLRPLQSLVVSLLLPLVSTLVLSRDWRRTISLKFFDTQVPSISTEELVLPRHARYVLSRLRFNGHSLLLGSYL